MDGFGQQHAPAAGAPRTTPGSPADPAAPGEGLLAPEEPSHGDPQGPDDVPRQAGDHDASALSVLFSED